MNVIKRYLLFYLATSFFYSILSFILDLVFYIMDYGSISKYDDWGSFLGYNIPFLMFYTPYALPVAILYNMFMNVYFGEKDNKVFRYVLALMFGLVIGMQVGRAGWNMYIGEYLPLKNTLLYGLVLLSVEIVRTIKKKNLAKKQQKECVWRKEEEDAKHLYGPDYPYTRV